MLPCSALQNNPRTICINASQKKKICKQFISCVASPMNKSSLFPPPWVGLPGDLLWSQMAESDPPVSSLGLQSLVHFTTLWAPSPP